MIPQIPEARIETQTALPEPAAEEHGAAEVVEVRGGDVRVTRRVWLPRGQQAVVGPHEQRTSEQHVQLWVGREGVAHQGERSFEVLLIAIEPGHYFAAGRIEALVQRIVHTGVLSGEVAE